VEGAGASPDVGDTRRAGTPADAAHAAHAADAGTCADPAHSADTSPRAGTDTAPADAGARASPCAHTTDARSGAAAGTERERAAHRTGYQHAEASPGKSVASHVELLLVRIDASDACARKQSAGVGGRQRAMSGALRQANQRFATRNFRVRELVAHATIFVVSGCHRALAACATAIANRKRAQHPRAV
jgi:hypothetical protein